MGKSVSVHLALWTKHFFYENFGKSFLNLSLHGGTNLRRYLRNKGIENRLRIYNYSVGIRNTWFSNRNLPTVIWRNTLFTLVHIDNILLFNILTVSSWKVNYLNAIYYTNTNTLSFYACQSHQSTLISIKYTRNNLCYNI